MRKSRYLVPLSLGVLMTFFLPAGQSAAQLAPPQQNYHLIAMLQLYGPGARDSFERCVYDHYRQGVSIKAAVKACALRLELDIAGGGGGDDPLSWRPLSGFDASTFDPESVVMACSATDGKLAKAPNKPNPYGYQDYGFFGRASWGGGTGVGKAESTGKKRERIDAYYQAELDTIHAQTAYDSAKDQRDEACRGKGKGTSKCNDAEKELAEKKQKLDDAKGNEEKKRDKAKDDPSNDPAPLPPPQPPKKKEVLEGYGCEVALETAREIYRECTRRNWKGAGCDILKAKIQHCPDVTKINVDPETGYECRAAVDPQLLVDAVTELCRQTTTPGPDGKDPCAGIKSMGSDFVFVPPGSPLCSNNPKAYVDPFSEMCSVPVSLPKAPSSVDPERILILLNKVGGPILVLPKKDPPVPPGTGPRPEPVTMVERRVDQPDPFEILTNPGIGNYQTTEWPDR